MFLKNSVFENANSFSHVRDLYEKPNFPSSEKQDIYSLKEKIKTQRNFYIEQFLNFSNLKLWRKIQSIFSFSNLDKKKKQNNLKSLFSSSEFGKNNVVNLSYTKLRVQDFVQANPLLLITNFSEIQTSLSGKFSKHFENFYLNFSESIYCLQEVFLDYQRELLLWNSFFGQIELQFVILFLLKSRLSTEISISNVFVVSVVILKLFETLFSDSNYLSSKPQGNNLGRPLQSQTISIYNQQNQRKLEKNLQKETSLILLAPNFHAFLKRILGVRVCFDFGSVLDFIVFFVLENHVNNLIQQFQGLSLKDSFQLNSTKQTLLNVIFDIDCHSYLETKKVLLINKLRELDQMWKD